MRSWYCPVCTVKRLGITAGQIKGNAVLTAVKQLAGHLSLVNQSVCGVSGGCEVGIRSDRKHVPYCCFLAVTPVTRRSVGHCGPVAPVSPFIRPFIDLCVPT